MTHYCLGFAFKDEWVYLIEKIKPDWQKGKLNGVGGKVEAGETPIEAMVREFEEETGVKTRLADWTFFTAMTFQDVKVFCYAANLPNGAEPISTTEEKVCCWSSQKLIVYDFRLLDNLKWLIPMARHVIEHPEAKPPPRTLCHE